MSDIVLVEGLNELNVQLTPVIVPIAGSIGPGLIWHEPLTAWEAVTSGREIPLNEEIHLSPGWINESEIAITGHVDLTVTYPDSTEEVLSAISGGRQDSEADPGNGWSVQFKPFVSSQEGTYTVVATLSSAGQVLDSVTFTLVGVMAVAELYMPAEMEAECYYPYPDALYWECTFRCQVTNCGDAPRTVALIYSVPSHDVTRTYEVTIQPGEAYIWEYTQLVDFKRAVSPLVVYLEGNWEGDNLSEGRCYKCAPYEWPAGRSDVVATVLDAWYEDEEDPYYSDLYLRIKIDSSEEIPGYHNVGQDYIDKEIPFDVKVDGAQLPAKGRQITGTLICTGGNYDEVRWSVGTIRYPREYPDEAYEFSCVETPGEYEPMVTIWYWAISGNVSPFAIAYYRQFEEATPWTLEMMVGPTMIRVWKAFNEYYPIVAFAHPDPDKRFDPDTWEMDNWIKVATK